MDVKQVAIAVCIALASTGAAYCIEWTDPRLRTDHISDADLIMANRSGMYPRVFSGQALRSQLRSGLVVTTDPRLSDARQPLAHTQAADTITGLASVATSGSYADLSNTPAIPAPQINSDWSAESGVTQILNKPATFAPDAHTQAAGTITGLAPVATSGSYADLSNTPAIPDAQVNSDWSAESGVSVILNKPTIPSDATQIAYAGSTVAAALDTLLYVPISITSYTLDSGSNVTREIGSSYTVGTLAWSTNKAATSQTVNSVAHTSPYAVNQTISTNQTYTLQVGDGQTTASSSRSVTFTHYRYWGTSTVATLDDAGVIALAGKEFSTSKAQSRTFTPVAEYLYVAYLATAGAALFTVNGFLDDSWVLVQRQFVNASGYSAEFRIYRSANQLTGTFAVVVS